MAKSDLLRHVRALHRACGEYLGTKDDTALVKAARRVVYERYSGGEWDKLKDAIGALEDIVGRPSREAEI